MPTARWITTVLGGLGALVLSMLAAAPATATPVGCELSIHPSSSSWSISGYNPFSSSPLSNTYQVTFSNTGSAVCSFDMLIDTDSQPYGLAGSGGQSLPYSLLDNTDNANLTPFSGQTPVASRPHFQIAAGGQQIVQFTFIVSLAQLPTDGDFDQQLLVAAQSGADILAEQQIQLSLNVAPSAVISLRGAYSTSSSGGVYISLGDLTAGPATTLLQLYVQSTGGYRLDAESVNKGQLQLVGNPGWSIPYSVVIGSHTLNLSSDAYFDTPRLGTARQDLLPMGFVIGDTSRRQAGRYEDVITLSVTAE